MLSKQVSELDLSDREGQLTQIVCLPNISWQTYQGLLQNMGDRRAARVAYDGQVVTIKMPSELPEFLNRLLAYIVRTIAVELSLLCIDRDYQDDIQLTREIRSWVESLDLKV